MSLNPFDLVNSINYTKEDILKDESDYNAFMVNKALSYFPDTIFYANDMNENWTIDNRLQYDYLMKSIRPRKRFSKWSKTVKSDDIRLIMEYFSYSHEKARQALKLISDEDMKIIKQSLRKGTNK